MLSMQHTGQVIARARRAKNMTQLALADQMGVSYQAVSNWERGQSMPDITKLPQLAEILNLTLEALLGQKSRLMEEIVCQPQVISDVEYAIDTEELVDAAPLLPPEQLESLFESVRGKLGDRDKAALLPFLSTEQCDELLRPHMMDERLPGEYIPFVSQSMLDETAAARQAAGLRWDELLPFLNSLRIGELAQSAYAQHGLKAIRNYVPFISQSDLQQIVMTECETNGPRQVAELAPFLSQEGLKRVIRFAVEHDDFSSIQGLLPFLAQDVLADLIK